MVEDVSDAYDRSVLNEAEVGSPDGGFHLSKREGEVLAMTAQGLTNQEIATKLEVSVHAVKFHLAGVYRKLGVSNRTEAASVYFRALQATDQPA